MCEGCEEIINEKKSVIRQAAYKHTNEFVGTNELISIINVKFFNWKRKQEGPIRVNNTFFHRIAYNAALDEIREIEVSIDSPKHKNLVDKIHFHDPSSYLLLHKIMKDCSIEEKDAISSIANREDPSEFAERYKITYANAIQKRRRAIKKVKDRLFNRSLERSYG